MTKPRSAASTVPFIDHYCQAYRPVFEDVRLFEHFKGLHLGLIACPKAKTLSNLSEYLGLKNSQGLHHFLRDSAWDVALLRNIRLWLTKLWIGDRAVTLIINEVGIPKKGHSTDYATRQYFNNLQKIENGLITLQVYAVVQGITYALGFEIFKPQSRLKDRDRYQRKCQLAHQLLFHLQELGIRINLILADDLSDEENQFQNHLDSFNVTYLLAKRSPQQIDPITKSAKRKEKWQLYEQKLSRYSAEMRYIRVLNSLSNSKNFLYQISKQAIDTPFLNKSWYLETNQTGDITNLINRISPLGEIQNWLEYGAYQILCEIGWEDFRLTHYASIEKWWEIILSVHLFMSFQANYHGLETFIS
ncbi:MAG: transposase [Snowella sp.]|nr:transposase [Snowella sp.]